MEALHQRQWTLGGEPSGHILTLDLCSTGDAIIAALQVLVAMCDAELKLSEVASGLTKAPQLLLNVDVDSPAAVCEHPDLVKAIAAHEQTLKIVAAYWCGHQALSRYFALWLKARMKLR